MIQRALVVLAACAVALTLGVTAQAQQRRASAKDAIHVPEMRIVLRPRAIVSIEIARVESRFASVEFREPFSTRVEQAAYKEPF
jgi:hypothetical protein